MTLASGKDMCQIQGQDLPVRWWVVLFVGGLDGGQDELVGGAQDDLDWKRAYPPSRHPH